VYNGEIRCLDFASTVDINCNGFRAGGLDGILIDKSSGHRRGCERYSGRIAPHNRPVDGRRRRSTVSNDIDVAAVDLATERGKRTAGVNNGMFGNDSSKESITNPEVAVVIEGVTSVPVQITGRNTV